MAIIFQIAEKMDEEDVLLPVLPTFKRSGNVCDI